MPSTSAPQAGLVRPRYQDGELEEPLPLEGLYRERFLTRGAPPAALVVSGPRGAGVSTALRHPAALEPVRAATAKRARESGPVSYPRCGPGAL